MHYVSQQEASIVNMEYTPVRHTEAVADVGPFCIAQDCEGHQ